MIVAARGVRTFAEHSWHHLRLGRELCPDRKGWLRLAHACLSGLPTGTLSRWAVTMPGASVQSCRLHLNMMFVEDFPERSDADARHDKRGCFGSFAVSILVRLTYRCPRSVVFGMGSSTPFAPWPSYTSGHSVQLPGALAAFQHQAQAKKDLQK